MLHGRYFSAAISFIFLGALTSAMSAMGLPPESTTLIGIVREVTFLGPPGFGENPKTDQKITVPVLKVIHSTAWMADNDGRSLSVGDDVELVVGEPPFLHNYVGKCIYATGGLERRTMASEYSSLVLFTYNVAPSTECR